MVLLGGVLRVWCCQLVGFGVQGLVFRVWRLGFKGLGLQTIRPTRGATSPHGPRGGREGCPYKGPAQVKT